MQAAAHHLVVFGLGYAGTAIARAAAQAGMQVTAASRHPDGEHPPAGVAVLPWPRAPESIARATHVLSPVPPDAAGDPVLAAFAPALLAAPGLRWAGYLSSTGVYGDRAGAWVDETTPAAPGSDRARRRVAAEQAWAGLAGQIPVDLFRTAGIYGPGRSAFDTLRAGRATRVLKPGHAFARVHRDDIARAVLAAMLRPRAPGLRVLHLADDEPAESATVLEEAARLLAVAPPPALPYERALASMSPMAASFWAENRKISSAATQRLLGLRWLYPSYREGLRAILVEEGGDRPA